MVCSLAWWNECGVCRHGRGWKWRFARSWTWVIARAMQVHSAILKVKLSGSVARAAGAAGFIGVL